MEDTIAAIATSGRRRYRIVRISGPKALDIAKEVFVFGSKKNGTFKDRYLHYGKVVDEKEML